MAIKLILSGDIHLHFHGDSDSQNNEAIARLEKKVDSLTLKITKFMALTEEQFTEVLDVINTATNQGADYAVAIGQKMDALKDEIKNAGLPADAEARILTRMDSVKSGSIALAESLRAMAADETNPVPVEPPTE